MSLSQDFIRAFKETPEKAKEWSNDHLSSEIEFKKIFPSDGQQQTKKLKGTCSKSPSSLSFYEMLKNVSTLAPKLNRAGKDNNMEMFFIVYKAIIT